MFLLFIIGCYGMTASSAYTIGILSPKFLI